MICFKFPSVLFLALLAASSVLKADDEMPDPGAVRRQIDALIANPPNHRLTLGTLRGAMALSISYGAPAWNADDHSACANFYVKTAESLCKAFPTGDNASPAARSILEDLKSALKRVKDSDDADANAWAMRYVFDKTEIALQTEADRSARLVALGQETMARGQFDDAVNAFTSATESLRELDGQPLDQIPVLCRYAPLGLGDALFGQKKYQEATSAIEQGLHFFPTLADEQLDIRKHFPDPALYHLLADDLRDSAAAHPDDSSLQFLRGYELYFTGHRDDAKPFFEKTIKLDPKNAGAKQMLEDYDPAHQKPKPQVPTGVGV